MTVKSVVDVAEWAWREKVGSPVRPLTQVSPGQVLLFLADRDRCGRLVEVSDGDGFTVTTTPSSGEAGTNKDTVAETSTKQRVETCRRSRVFWSTKDMEKSCARPMEGLRGRGRRDGPRHIQLKEHT
jgi:hypothetical protein